MQQVKLEASFISAAQVREGSLCPPAHLLQRMFEPLLLLFLSRLLSLPGSLLLCLGVLFHGLSLSLFLQLLLQSCCCCLLFPLLQRQREQLCALHHSNSPNSICICGPPPCGSPPKVLQVINACRVGDQADCSNSCTWTAASLCGSSASLLPASSLDCSCRSSSSLTNAASAARCSASCLALLNSINQSMVSGNHGIGRESTFR